MVFSSTIFLFLFLPAVLITYLITPRPLKNIVLLIASLFFYAWGEGFFVLVMLASIAANYIFGLLIEKTSSPLFRKIALASGIVVNLALLIFCKYANFLVDNLNTLLTLAEIIPIDLAPVHLPIGISFFTFQAMSYIMDCYSDEAPVQHNPLTVALYISLFPQLIAGPIVRYHDVAKQLLQRTTTVERFAYGVQRFVIGLGKKVLIANTVAIPADAIFSLPPDQLTPGLAWLGIICYTAQIYFDFSGYSDMAIGLGHMFGFHFLENFNYPYISKSITEFWRRWHISLSSWFRDYLYIPLGGNRKGRVRTYTNLVLVFFLCGLWHGAAWTFVVWGLFHGFFLVLERAGFGAFLERIPRVFRHSYTLIVAMIGWVFFRSETFQFSLQFIAAMFGFAQGSGVVENIYTHTDTLVWCALFASILGSTPLLALTANRLAAKNALGKAALGSLRIAVVTGILILCVLQLGASTHNPFIYFRF